MITQVEALRYRCLKHVRQPLGRFHILAGPNGSGKSTFLDAIGLLGRLVSEGLDAAIRERTRDFRDLVWMRSGEGFELAVEARIPEGRRGVPPGREYDTVRYEAALGMEHGELAILTEKVLMKATQAPPEEEQRELFPDTVEAPLTILTGKGVRGTRTVVHKGAGGNDNFYDETGKGWDHAFRLGARKSALGNLPEDESKFPVSTWLRSLLADGVQRVALEGASLRRGSAPGQARGFKADGSGLAEAVEALERADPGRFREWMAQVRRALPGLESVRTVEREDDRLRYLLLGYGGGLEVPSWMASEGALRLLALTLPAWLPSAPGVLLIEEPENGLDAGAAAGVVQALAAAQGVQILATTHSPVILGAAEPGQVLCFAADGEGATGIVCGARYEALEDWTGVTG